MREDNDSIIEDFSGRYPLHVALEAATGQLANNPGFTITIDIMTVTLVASAALYAVCCRLAHRKFNLLHALEPQMTTKKLLILSVLLASLLRIMTILGVAAMNMANVRAHYSLQPSQHRGDKTQDFYDEAMTVLFDLPNCIVVSTYILITLVWAECFLEARFHTENAAFWKRRLLIMFMIFNTLLYATQLILYACVFFSGSNTLVRFILYAAITGINFTAVVLVLVFYIYLNIRFSGFPYRSDELKASLTRMSTVMTLWSFTRVIWGVATLLVYIHDVELLQDTDTPARSFALLFVVFFVCEILPIVILLDYSYYMQLITRCFRRLSSDDGEPQLTSHDNTLDLIHERADTESDSLILQRPLNTVDHLLLTSPRDGIMDTGHRLRRVRFQDATHVADDPLLLEAL